MSRRGPLAQLGMFVVVLIGVNIVLAIVGSSLRISIIGSIVLSLVVGVIMSATSRRR